MLRATGIVATAIVAFAAVLSVAPTHHAQKAMSAALILANLGAAVLCLDRARSFPKERIGWLLLSASFPLVLLSRLTLAAPGTMGLAPRPMDGANLAVTVIIALLQIWGILSWPWRNPERSPRMLDFLGSLLFSASVFLFLWVLGIWQLGFRADSEPQIRTLALAGRMAITSGAVIYLLSQDPRRILGPLGWVLTALVFLGLIVALRRPSLLDGNLLAQTGPWIALLTPISFALAAWSRSPLEVASDRPALRFPLTETITYLPFLLSGGVLGLAVLEKRSCLTWPLLAFLGITGLLVLRQFVLLREIKSAKARLEERVAQRTQILEKMQALMLKTERLNTTATLGAGLAHDLNNLLGAILNTAELMKMDLAEGSNPSEQDLRRIIETSSKAGGLTQRLMAFARSEGNTGAPRPPLDLTQAIVSMEELLRMMLPPTIQLNLEIDAPPCQAQIEIGVLEQILVNLVGNAKDAMPSGGLIRLHLGPGTMLDGTPAHILAVSDTGPGVPPEIEDSIFESFFTTKPEGKGTGLGLASVKALLENHPGQGATFILAFPIKA